MKNLKIIALPVLMALLNYLLGDWIEDIGDYLDKKLLDINFWKNIDSQALLGLLKENRLISLVINLIFGALFV